MQRIGQWLFDERQLAGVLREPLPFGVRRLSGMVIRYETGGAVSIRPLWNWLLPGFYQFRGRIYANPAGLVLHGWIVARPIIRAVALTWFGLVALSGLLFATLTLIRVGTALGGYKVMTPLSERWPAWACPSS